MARRKPLQPKTSCSFSAPGDLNAYRRWYIDTGYFRYRDLCRDFKNWVLAKVSIYSVRIRVGDMVKDLYINLSYEFLLDDGVTAIFFIYLYQMD